MRCFVPALTCQSGRSCDPPGVPPHDFEYENLGRRTRHGLDIQRGFPGRYGNILRHGSKARARIRDRQVVVDGFWHMDRLHRETHSARQLGDLVTGIGRVSAAVVEEIPDVVRPEDLDKAFVLRRALFETLELVASRTEGAPWCMAQRRDSVGRLARRVDHVLEERTEYAVTAGIDAPDPVRVLPGCFDDATGACVDDRGHAARLGVEGIFCHVNVSPDPQSRAAYRNCRR